MNGGPVLQSQKKGPPGALRGVKLGDSKEMVVMWAGIAVIGLVIVLLLVVRTLNAGGRPGRLGSHDRPSDPPISQGGGGGP